MKAKSFSIGLLGFLFLANGLFAQSSSVKKEDIKVWGNCGMCKNTIEKAAKSAGATEAEWNEDTKVLTVSYEVSKTDNQKIQKAVVATGYDTQDFTAADETYSKLHGCCKYDRKPKAVQQVAAEMSSGKTGGAKCCDMPNCGKGADCCKGSDCCKGGKCEMAKDGKSMDCCKDGQCKKGKDGKAMDCCKSGKGDKAKAMDCCKEGKCEKHKGDASTAMAGCKDSGCCKS